MKKRGWNIKIRIVSKEKKMIIPYSPTKSKANPLLENSVLNPLTNSLSPSIKSKGARPHSARILILHRIKKGVNKKNLLDLENITILKLSDVKNLNPPSTAKIRVSS
jgi:hypothetical protein